MSCPKCDVSSITTQRPIIESTFESLRKMNLPPPQDMDRQRVDGILVANENYRSLLLEKKQALTAALLQVDAELDVVEDRACSLRAIFHPIRNLPNEILHEILFPLIDNVLQAPFRPPSFPIRQTNLIQSFNVARHPLWIFTHVCKQWRNHLLSLPHLWSYVHVNLTTYPSPSLVNLLISRARDCFFHVSIQERSSRPLPWAPPFYLLELFRRTDKWQSLVLLTNIRAALNGVSADFPPNGRFPALQSLRLPIAGRDPTPDFHFHGFVDAVKLRHANVNLSRNGLEYFSEVVPLPWHGLTSIVVRDGHIDSITSLLQLLPNLLAAESRDAWASDRQPPTVDWHATLRSFTLVQYQPSDLLGHLRLPMLDSLTVLPSFEPDMWDDGGFPALLSRLHPSGATNLKTLTVTFPSIKYNVGRLPGLRDLLESVPALEILSITLGCKASLDPLCQMLTQSEKSMLIPLLKRLTLTVQPRSKLPHSLLKMAKSRSPGLKKVIVKGVVP